MNSRHAVIWIFAAVMLGSAACLVGTAQAAKARPDSSVVLKGDQPGTVFRTLTVEGEDRVHLEIARPTLHLDLDPADAPGLDLGSARDVLDRTRPDLVGPLLASVPAVPSRHTGRPWLSEMATGPVARFRPEMSGVQAWALTVTDSRGQTTASFSGKGNPPDEISWTGRTEEGSPALPGLMYSYVLEAHDKAGNRRHFMGEGFQVPAYRAETKAGPIMVLPASALTVREHTMQQGAATAAALEIASWVNQEPLDLQVEVAVVARSHERGAAIARTAREQIEANVLGDRSRVRERVIVESEAPENGAVVVRLVQAAK